MGFWSLFEVASMPMLQILILSSLGAFMATDYLRLLPADARKSMNKIVYVAFTPALMFASLAKTVTLQDIISWWFMPVNIGITFLIGGSFGWIAVKLLKPKPHLEGLIIAMCSTGNLGNILLIIIPAICVEDGNPFGKKSVCSTVGLSYVSFSMALGGFYIWTYTYYLIRTSATRYQDMLGSEFSKKPNNDIDADEGSRLLNGVEEAHINVSEAQDGLRTQMHSNKNVTCWTNLLRISNQIMKELMTPPTIGAILGFIFGAVTWLRNLIIGDNAPLHVIQDSVKLLGDGTIPCLYLIMGGNLTQGLHKTKLNPMIIIAVIVVRYVILPASGILVVKAAANLGLLPPDPLFHFVLMIHFTIPPAMSIGTLTELFDVAQEECSILFLWTYLVAALALTVWSTIFMWILS